MVLSLLQWEATELWTNEFTAIINDLSSNYEIFFTEFFIQIMLPMYDIILALLTYFQPMFHFHTPWKHQKTGRFLMFLGDIEVEHGLKMG